MIAEHLPSETVGAGTGVGRKAKPTSQKGVIKIETQQRPAKSSPAKSGGHRFLSTILVTAVLLMLVAPLALGATAGGAEAVPGEYVGMLRGVHAVDAQTAWAVGGANVWGVESLILKTTDGGRNWAIQGHWRDNYLQSVSAADADVAWAVGIQGNIIRTSDGGVSWTSQDQEICGSMHGVTAVNKQTAWVVGAGEASPVNDDGAIIRTSDGGETWVKQKEVDAELYGVDSVDGQTAWAVGHSGTILKTTDGGSTWNQQTSGVEGTLYSVAAVDAMNAWAVGSDAILRTTDGGTTWNQRPTGIEWDRTHMGERSPNPPIGVSAADADTVWVTGSSGQICHTEDGGQTWVSQKGGTSWLYSACAVNENEVWAVGDSSILRTANGGDTWSRQGLSNPPADTWYLAEGSTGGSFETWVLVQNPGDADANVTLTFQTPGGQVPGPNAVVKAGTRSSFNVADTVPGVDSVSTTVTSNAPVVAERAMYWNGRAGGHDSLGVTAPMNVWYLAEGSTGGSFETWVLVQNPGDADANVTLTFQTPGGQVPGPNAVVKAGTRSTFNVADTVPGVDSVSTTVTSTLPVVAERAMYWNGRAGGHASVGTTMVTRKSYLAEGSTGGSFETWVLVQNPGDADANVTLTFQTPGGQVPGPNAVVKAGARSSFNVADTVTGVDSVSTTVTSTLPVVAERAMYWNGRAGGHVSISAIAALDTWYLAEGSTGGSFETWVLVQNPGAAEAIVTVTFQTRDGEVPGPQVRVPAGGRHSFNVADTVPGVDSVSTTVTSNVPVVAERAVYWNGRTGGHDSTGAGFRR